jgi:hypothetical protein
MQIGRPGCKRRLITAPTLCKLTNARTCGMRMPVAPASSRFEGGVYLTRFHTNGAAAAAAPPPDGAGLVYLRSSAVTERLIRF